VRLADRRSGGGDNGGVFHGSALAIASFGLGAGRKSLQLATKSIILLIVFRRL
jgi:hypothetical protein